MAVETLAVAEEEAELRLDRWFRRHYPGLAHGMLEKLLRTGQVRVDGKRASSNQRLETGQLVRVPPMPTDAPPDRPQTARIVPTTAEARALRDSVLYRDDDMIVIDKAPGIAVQGGTGQSRPLDALLSALSFDKDEAPRLVHRLDRDTSGVLVLGRSASAAARLAAAFKERAARKCYWALTVGVPVPRKGRIDAPLAKVPGRTGEKMGVDEDEGRRAVTWYRVVDAARGKAAWLELEPRTGRTHQLRAHCLLLETPIQGDGKYGGAAAYLPTPEVGKGLHLHARAIRLPAKRGRDIEVTAPLPDHMAASFAFLGFTQADAGPPFLAFEGE